MDSEHPAAKWILVALLLMLLFGMTACPETGCFRRQNFACTEAEKEQARREAEMLGSSSTTGAESTTTSTESAPAPRAEEPVFEVWNHMAVQNGGAAPQWTVDGPMLVTKIQTYHWNDAQGSSPGTIGLRSSSGTLYGPWQAEGLPGQNDVPDAYWLVTPNTVLPPGTYTVVDSDPATWAQNAETGGVAFTLIYAEPAE